MAKTLKTLPFPDECPYSIEGKSEEQMLLSAEVTHHSNNTILSGMPQLPPLLYGDERRFKQVLINLVKNAIKFTTWGSIKIMTSYDEEEEMLITQVIDTGAGIASKDLGKLFNRFGKL